MAKMAELKGLKSEAAKQMGGKLNGLSGMKPEGMQKVSVMADSKKGLEKGLDTAEDLLEKTPRDVLGTESMEDPEAKLDAIVENLSEEECDSLLEKLMAKKAEKESEESLSDPADADTETSEEDSDEY